MKILLWLSGLMFSLAVLILLLAFPLDHFGIIHWSDSAMFGLLLLAGALIPAMFGGLWFLWKKLK